MSVHKKTYEAVLPESYHEVYSIDAKNKRVSILLTVANLIVSAVLILLFILILCPKDFFGNFNLARNSFFILSLAAYIVLHELTHGLAYKLLTGRKLTFGLTFSVAYCGVPDIYVYRKTALISLLAPFTVFSIVFLLLVALLTDPWDQFYAAIAFAIHAGGCVGDLYGTLLYLFRFRDPKTLMRDTGPKQSFFLPRTAGGEQKKEIL